MVSFFVEIRLDDRSVKRAVQTMKRMFTALMLALSQLSCVMVGGYSSDGGWWVWPGSLLSVLVIVIVLFLFLRRRR